MVEQRERDNKLLQVKPTKSKILQWVFECFRQAILLPLCQCFLFFFLLATAKCEEEDVACGMWQVEFKRQAQLIARFNQNCIVVLGLYRTGDCCLLYVVCTAIWLPTGMRLVYMELGTASVWNGFVTSGWGGGEGEGNEWNWVSMSLADLFNWKHFKSVEEMSFYPRENMENYRRYWKSNRAWN